MKLTCRRKFFLVLSISLVAFSFYFLNQEASVKRDQPTVQIGEYTFQVEVVRTPEEWARGLMFRERLAPFQGMLFFGQEERLQHFWMKNTPLSLDIIFISNDLKIAHIHHEAKPLSTESISSQKPVTHVLEILGGRAKALEIEVGNSVRFRNL